MNLVFTLIMINLKKFSFGTRFVISGFTMIEFLVVILIIAILFAISIPTYLAIAENARCVYVGEDYYSKSNCGVIITDPSDDSAVPRIKSFRGTFKKVPMNSVSWVYVHPSIDQQYYYSKIGELYKTPKKIIGDRTWNLSDVYIGDPTNSGKDFEIGTLTTQGAITEELEKPFDSDKGNSRPELLEGRRGHTITVHRE